MCVTPQGLIIKLDYIFQESVDMHLCYDYYNMCDQ